LRTALTVGQRGRKECFAARMEQKLAANRHAGCRGAPNTNLAPEALLLGNAGERELHNRRNMGATEEEVQDNVEPARIMRHCRIRRKKES